MESEAVVSLKAKAMELRPRFLLGILSPLVRTLPPPNSWRNLTKLDPWHPFSRLYEVNDCYFY